MIYDCFTFFNELDLLEIRLNVLNAYVDKFVIVEATRTFTNNEKPLYYEQNKQRFKQFEEKIIHIVLDDYPSEENIKDWTIETLQRNCIKDALKDCSDDDWIMISDLDEIPRPELIKKVYNPNKIVAFDCDVYTYFLNNFTVGYKWTHGTKLLSYKNFKSLLNGIDFSKYYAIDENVNKGVTPTCIRLYYGKKQIHIPNAGWHFSYIGNMNNVMQKFEAIVESSNKNMSEQDCIKKIHEKKFLNTYYLVPVVLDERFPEYIRKNLDKYKELIITDNTVQFDLRCSLLYKIKYFLENIFNVKDDVRFDIKRTILTILGIKIRIKKEKIKG